MFYQQTIYTGYCHSYLFILRKTIIRISRCQIYSTDNAHLVDPSGYFTDSGCNSVVAGTVRIQAIVPTNVTVLHMEFYLDGKTTPSPAGPVGPVAPVGPVSPATPVAPVIVALPAGPVAPVIPAPVGPVGP